MYQVIEGMIVDKEPVDRVVKRCRNVFQAKDACQKLEHFGYVLDPDADPIMSIKFINGNRKPRTAKAWDKKWERAVRPSSK